MSTDKIGPPPPPPITNYCISHNKPKTLKIIQSNKLISDTYCKWAENYPELRLACVRFGVCLGRPPYKMIYKHVKSLLQEGPTCGMVSISMLLNNEIKPANLLSLSREKNISKNGELFSVCWVESLLDLASRKVNRNLKFEARKTNLFSNEIIELLLDGCLLLVPYDCDKNHTPCMMKGHKAHWALVTGIVITKPYETLDEVSPDQVFVAAKHGKSLHVGLWKLYDLDRSNNNLEEFAPDRKYDNLEYILPDGGLIEGLKGQFILIYP